MVTESSLQAEAQGVRVGDEIVSIGGKEVVGSMNAKHVRQLIQMSQRPFDVLFEREHTETEAGGATAAAASSPPHAGAGQSEDAAGTMRQVLARGGVPRVEPSNRHRDSATSVSEAGEAEVVAPPPRNRNHHRMPGKGQVEVQLVNSAPAPCQCTAGP